jgi:hypothetical protein
MTQSLPREYYYDAAGNRILRKVMEVKSPELSPPPQDSLPPLTSPPPQDTTTTLTSQTSLESTAEDPAYFVETLAQTQIKIYPNPTTEKVTMEITGWETLQTGEFKLYSLTGQLLQEQPVHSLNTTISLAGLPKGAYILKVQINDQGEDWRIIKN